MKGLFIVATLFCGVLALLTGRAEALGAEMMAAGDAAVELGLTLCGAYMIWCGLLRVIEEAGLAEKLAHRLSGAMRLLIGREAEDELVCQSAGLNLTANLLGLGNAATPLGIRAARRMAKGCDGVASDELCLLVVLNTASIQLLPTTVASVRAAFGSAAPFDILPAVWISSLASVTVGLLTARLLSRRKGGPA